MLAKVFVYATLFAAGAFGAAVPAADSQFTPADMSAAGDALAVCAQRGIDPHGSIPSDANMRSPGTYEFAADSDASHWARAQVALASSNELEKRQAGNIGIGMWAQDNCSGQGVWVDNVNYNVNYYTATNLFSVGISYRGLRNNEHLDFSKTKGGDFCGTYTYSAGFQTPVGCFNSQLINCFRLWQ